MINQIDDIKNRYDDAKCINGGPQRNDTVFPHWIDGGHQFWYLRDLKNGKQFRLVDPETKSNELAFDHRALALTLQENTGKTIDANNLPIKIIELSLLDKQVHFLAFQKHWGFCLDSLICSEIKQPKKGVGSPDGKTTFFSPPKRLLSPNKQKLAFTRDSNLWVRDVLTGQEKALTEDGTQFFGYARASFIGELDLQAVWSSDSRQLFTFQLDYRAVSERPTMRYAPLDGSLQPRISNTRMPYPGDENIGLYYLKVIDSESGTIQTLNYDSLPVITPAGRFFSEKRGWWSSDNSRVLFVDEARGGKTVRLLSCDIKTGETQQLFEEQSDTFVKLNHSSEEIPVLLPLPETDELIWFSERNDWGHLYLYDTKTGKEKCVITCSGPHIAWNVRSILHYDASLREIVIQTSGRDKHINPHYSDICKVNIDSGELTPIAVGNFEYTVLKHRSLSAVCIGKRDIWGIDNDDVDGVCPDGQYIVATRSRADVVPVSLLLDRQGQTVLTLETADLSDMPEGWLWPEPVMAKAADGETDLHTIIYHPPGFSPEQCYPVIDFASNTRSFASMPIGSFTNSPVYGAGYLLCLSMAALGFVVVSMGGRGGPNRGKKFQDHKFGDPAGSNDADDHVAAIQQLAKTRPYMDLNRVGIAGMDIQSAAVYRFFKRQDFYKVATFIAPVDIRSQLPGTVEQYYGLSTFLSGDSEPPCKFIEDYAESLEGKLLLIVGGLEDYTPAGTLRLVDALQAANKDFDMLFFPNGISNPTGYTTRREWDFLVRHLQHIEPPKNFQLKLFFEHAVDEIDKYMEAMAD